MYIHRYQGPPPSHHHPCTHHRNNNNYRYHKSHRYDNHNQCFLQYSFHYSLHLHLYLPHGTRMCMFGLVVYSHHGRITSVAVPCLLFLLLLLLLLLFLGGGQKACVCVALYRPSDGLLATHNDRSRTRASWKRCRQPFAQRSRLGQEHGRSQ